MNEMDNSCYSIIKPGDSNTKRLPIMQDKANIDYFPPKNQELSEQVKMQGLLM